jgi:hypothetical protein
VNPYPARYRSRFCIDLQPSASRTSSRTPANPSDESLGYFQSSANADSEGTLLFVPSWQRLTVLKRTFVKAIRISVWMTQK